MSSDKIVVSNNDLINKKSVALLSRLKSNKSKKSETFGKKSKKMENSKKSQTTDLIKKLKIEKS